MSNLKDIRKKINEIDEQMAKLFEERMKASSEVANYKKEHALPIFDSSREQELINKNLEYITDEDIKPYYVNFLKDTMDISKKYQSALIDGIKVAYSGVKGAFAYIAAKKMFPNANYVSYLSFQDAYHACEKGECDVCVLPLENSYAGEVGLVMDLMFSGSLYVNQVLELEVTHNLISKKGAKLENIKTVYSHKQALDQCVNFINEHNLETVESLNTALAAKYVSEQNDNTIAAIASSDTAEIYDLEVLQRNINVKNTNTTRFGAFCRSLNKTSNKKDEHCILVFTVKNEAGALAKTLNIIGSHGFNMRSLRSRPMKELIWNYYFYVEIEGNINSIEGKEMLRALGIFCDKLKVVGCYNL